MASGYALGMIFGGSFLFTLYYIFSLNLFIGFGIVALIVAISLFLLLDPDNFEEVIEVEPVPYRENLPQHSFVSEYEYS